MSNPYVIEAKRMLEIFHDREWAQTDLHNLIPHLINEVERLSDEDESAYLKGEIESLCEERNDLHGELEKLDKEVARLEQRERELEAELDRAEQTRWLMDDEIESYKEEIDDLKAEIAGLNADRCSSRAYSGL